MNDNTELLAMDAEDARSEMRRPARTCLECGCRGYHTQGCPGAEDYETELESDDE